jgi:hypothetical protein
MSRAGTDTFVFSADQLAMPAFWRIFIISVLDRGIKINND